MQALKNSLIELSSFLTDKIFFVLQIKILNIKIQTIYSNRSSSRECSNSQSNQCPHRASHTSQRGTHNQSFHCNRGKSNSQLSICSSIFFICTKFIHLSDQISFFIIFDILVHIQTKKCHIKKHSTLKGLNRSREFCPTREQDTH